MREDWKKKSIGEIATVSYGFTDKAVTEGTYRYVRITDIDSNGVLTVDEKRFVKPSEEIKNFILEDNDLLMARTGATFAKVLLYRDYEPSIFASYLIRINFKEKVLNKLYWYFSKSEDYWQQANKLSSGSAQPHFNGAALKKVIFTYPNSQLEQQQIVSILDKAFAAIDKAKANIEKNLQNTNDLFQSKLNEVFSQNGEGWEEKKIEDLTEIVTKGSSPKWQGVNYVEEQGILFITSENVGEGKLLTTKRKFVEEKFNMIEKKSILKKGDVLTNIVGASIGRTAIYNLEDVANINQAVCIMRCKGSELYNHYLMHILNSPYFKNILHDNEVNNARANLSLTFFKNLKIPIPNVEKQMHVVGQIEAINRKTNVLVNNFENKLSNLEELKKSILQEAFAGELTN